MPLYEIVLRFPSHEELRLTDHDPGAGGRGPRRRPPWVVVAEEDGGRHDDVLKRYVARPTLLSRPQAGRSAGDGPRKSRTHRTFSPAGLLAGPGTTSDPLGIMPERMFFCSCKSGHVYVRPETGPNAMTAPAEARLNGSMATAVAPAEQALVPPQNLDAEESVLGAMLLSPGAISAVTEVIDAGSFYRESHAKIFRACIHLFAQRRAGRRDHVADELEERGELDAAAAGSASTSWRGSSRPRRTPPTTRASSARWPCSAA